MPRRRKADGKKPPRNQAKKLRLRELLPRVGFDFADKRCHAVLSGVDSVTIKEHIRSFAGDLNKLLVDQALTAIFEPAIAAIKAEPDSISDVMPGEFWEGIKQTLPWTSGALTGHAVFSLVVALVFSHEKYDAACPYERFKHQYGKLAEAVHEFSGLLKQHHGDNPLFMSFYYDSSVSLPSDDEEDDEKDDEEDVEEAGPSRGEEAPDEAMPDYQGGEDEGEDEGEDGGEELAGAVKAMDLD